MYRWTATHPIFQCVMQYEGEELPEDLQTSWNSNGFDISDPEDITYELALKEYELKRRIAYPSVESQLEADYHARLGDTSMRLELDQQITAVKLQYPKPEPKTEADLTAWETLKSWIGF